MKKTLAVINNNPGNIRFSKFNNWIGQIGSNKGYVVFDSPFNGFRALVKLLLNYYFDKGLRSVKDILSVFAPYGDKDNDPYAYSNYVVKSIYDFCGSSDFVNGMDYVFNLSETLDRKLFADMILTIASVEGFNIPFDFDDVLVLVNKFVSDRI